MNRYDEYFDFRMAGADDIDAIMSFIKEHWDSSHILANDRSFFEYHFGGLDGGVNVFLMCEKAGRIVGMLGFVRYSIKSEVAYISGSITKVKEGLPVPMCGIELMKRFYQHVQPFVEFAAGVNAQTILPIFSRVFKYHTGVLDQYYLPNKSLRDFKIITVPQKVFLKTEECSDEQDRLVKLENLEDTPFDFKKCYPKLPLKDKAFLSKRYFCHPIFHYDTYGIEAKSGIEGILFTRKVVYNGSAIILIVDFVGSLDSLGKIGTALQRLLHIENAECFSFLEAGMPQGILERSGFQKIDREADDVIVPTYFEPFANCNITNYYITSDPDLIIFKAAGDQDNPKYTPGGQDR